MISFFYKASLNQTYIEFEIKLERKYYRYMLETVVPAGLLVAISWLHNSAKPDSWQAGSTGNSVPMPGFLFVRFQKNSRRKKLKLPKKNSRNFY